MVRVVLAEDHNIVRQGTRLFLESVGIDVIGEARNGREAVELTRTLHPDIVIMDIHLPELTGIEATRRIRHEFNDVHVIALTAYDEPAYVHALLDAGADGFVLKTAEMSELLNAIQEVSVGWLVSNKQLSSQNPDNIKQSQPLVEGLTKREIEVLEQASYGLTNKQIGKILCISDRTVQGHLQNIYQKLGAISRTEAVAYALHHELISLDETK